ncbi:hypothetical protein [Streptomyces sp. NPDC020597]|uniref:hypothetical protein n=1 Tax=unclassified Streptomyces TaxID=2593676 RepID=UPI0037996D1F
MTRQKRELRALHLLRTAREAARLLDDPQRNAARERKVWELQRATAELLGLPLASVPLDTVQQKKLVTHAGELAVLLRAYNWGEQDLALAAVQNAVGRENVGERGAADGFDALGKLVLPTASPEGWAGELAARAAEGNEYLERAVKLGKYLLHPTPLLILDDLTEIVGQAVHSLNVRKLTGCVNDLGACLAPKRRAEPDVLPEDDRLIPGRGRTPDSRDLAKVAPGNGPHGLGGRSGWSL